MVRLEIRRSILEINNFLAEQNRKIFKQAGIKTINLISSPGAGKTTLIEKTINFLKNDLRIGVIEGDIETTRDAERIARYGVKVVQIETQGSCHLNIAMLIEAISVLDLSILDLLFIENVGNLVCPVELDLGEHIKIAILSVPEGDDKPAKYPKIFFEAEVLIINKIDLLAFTDCSIKHIRTDCYKLNPQQIIFELSCRTGEGLISWINWLKYWIKS